MNLDFEFQGNALSKDQALWKTPTPSGVPTQLFARSAISRQARGDMASTDTPQSEDVDPLRPVNRESESSFHTPDQPGTLANRVLRSAGCGPVSSPIGSLMQIKESAMSPSSSARISSIGKGSRKRSRESEEENRENEGEGENWTF